MTERFYTFFCPTKEQAERELVLFELEVRKDNRYPVSHVSHTKDGRWMVTISTHSIPVRVREMNAELPREDREMLKLKGMI